MKKTLTALVAVAILAAGCGGDPDSAEADDKPVQAIVNVDLRYPLQELCKGALEYEGITEGASVTFRDKSGDILGTAELPAASEDSTAMNCYWRLEAQLSEPSEFVTAEIAGWTSKPEEADARSRFVFTLEATEPGADGGEKARIDPGWSKTG